jgi:serine/threonine protein kinase
MIIDKNRLQKSSLLFEGGEAKIYDCPGDNNKVLKIYLDKVDFVSKESKVKLLLSKVLPKNVIGPLEIITDLNGKFIGYIMKKVNGGERFKELTNKDFIKSHNIKIKNIIEMIIEIKNTIIDLHSQNIIISDLNYKNVLFDNQYNTYIIDIDSFVIGNYKNDVCMEFFKDPLLVGNNFTKETDAYAFSILLFQSLTRLHPFGGTMEPDLSLFERMKRGISVIDHPEIVVPNSKKINRWEFMNPELLSELLEIYTNKQRFLISKSVDDLNKSLKLCQNHGEYYFGQYNECPVCNKNAQVISKPTKIISDDKKNVGYTLLFSDRNTMYFIDIENYISKNKKVIGRNVGEICNYEVGVKYYILNNKDYFKVYDNYILIKDQESTKINKNNKSMVILKNNSLYYISQNDELLKLEITNKGNNIKSIQKVAFNCIFDICDDSNYFICNIYDGLKIINVDEYSYMWYNNDKINEYGIHYDSVSKTWLFIIQNQKGEFKTFVFNKNNIVFESEKINYIVKLSNICFYNNTIFIPGDGFIRGYNYQKNVFKDFKFDIVNEDSKLIKDGNKFTVINEQEIYQIG